MDPERKAVINGHVVHEYYWAGQHPVYVDSRLVEGSFEDVVKSLEADHVG